MVYRTPGVQSREYSLLMLAQGHDAQNLHGCVKSDKQLLRLENSKVNEMDSYSEHPAGFYTSTSWR